VRGGRGLSLIRGVRTADETWDSSSAAASRTFRVLRREPTAGLGGVTGRLGLEDRDSDAVFFDTGFGGGFGTGALVEEVGRFDGLDDAGG
jgi:hypothetical protein